MYAWHYSWIVDDGFGVKIGMWTKWDGYY